MDTITETATWTEALPGIQTTDPVLGGVAGAGPLNAGTKVIGGRTRYLKAQHEATLAARTLTVFSTPGTVSYSFPAGATRARIICVGAGASGSGAALQMTNDGTPGGGGGGSGYRTEWVGPISSLPSTVTIEVGAPGNAVARGVRGVGGNGTYVRGNLAGTDYGIVGAVGGSPGYAAPGTDAVQNAIGGAGGDGAASGGAGGNNSAGAAVTPAGGGANFGCCAGKSGGPGNGAIGGSGGAGGALFGAPPGISMFYADDRGNGAGGAAGTASAPAEPGQGGRGYGAGGGGGGGGLKGGGGGGGAAGYCNTPNSARAGSGGAFGAQGGGVALAGCCIIETW